MDEKEARSELRKYRRYATQLQTFLEKYKVMIDKYPEIEAKLIVSGQYHKTASHWITSILAKASEEDIQILQLPRELTEQGWERIFRDHFSPFGVVQGVIMPLAMYGLLGYEQIFIENQWKLPKWKRADWLLEMEKGISQWN